MMKKWLSACLAASLLLLPGCRAPDAGGTAAPGTPAVSTELPAPSTEPSMPGEEGRRHVLTPCRIIDGAETGNLILVGVEDDQVYSLSVEGMVVVMDGGSSGRQELRDGMKVEVGNTGVVLETFPAQFASAGTIAGNSGDIDDTSGLYLQVLEDLWSVDSGLNEDIAELGVDLSRLEGLTQGEKSALAYVFGMAHGLMPILGTREELKEQGYFTEVDLGGEVTAERKLYEWKDGCLFSIEGNVEGFTAEKWCAPLGAYVFYQCAAAEVDGVWTYEIGSEMIS